METRSRTGSRIKSAVHAIAALFVAALLSTCGTGFKDISDPNGQQAIVDQANNFLTLGQCDNAINVLNPLYNSIYCNNAVRQVYASALACKGGFSFPTLLAALAAADGTDIWSPVVKSNYSSGSGDRHLYNLNLASDTLRQTADPPNAFEAISRTNDVNLYMVFIQMSIIGSVISPLGNADQATGHQQQAIGASTAADQCYVQVAIATISDSLRYVNTGTAVDKVVTSINSICGGACPQNKDLTVCLGSAALQAQGVALLTAIDGQWL